MSWHSVASSALACLALACGGRSSLMVGEPFDRDEDMEPPAHPCIWVEPDGQSRKRVSAKVAPVRADILFLLDNSTSMGEEIEQIATQLRERLVPAFQARTEETQLGVAVTSDFGHQPLGAPNHPYRLLQPISEDIDGVQEALRSITLEVGGDDPESQLEALYQVATGEGIPGLVDPRAACQNGGRAGVCFREQSFAMVMVFTDAPMRNVAGLLPDGSIATDVIDDLDDPRRPQIPYVRQYDETLAALQAEGIRVVGLWSGRLADGLDDLRRVVHDTGTLDDHGQPVLFDIGTHGEALGEGVVSTLDLARSGTRLDLELRLRDPDDADGADTTSFVTNVLAVAANPEEGARADGARFTEVREGTELTFELIIDTTGVGSELQGQRLPLTLSIEDSAGMLLWEETFDVVVAWSDSECRVESGTRDG